MGISENENRLREVFLHQGEEKQVTRGGVIFTAGQQSNFVRYVESGSVSLKKTASNGRTLVVDIAREGDIIK